MWRGVPGTAHPVFRRKMFGKENGSEERRLEERFSEKGFSEKRGTFFCWKFKTHFPSVFRMTELQFTGTEPERFCAFFLSVFAVSDQRTSQMSHLHADLMVASGIEVDLQKTASAPGIEHPVAESCQLCPGSSLCAHAGGIGTPVFYEVVFQCIRILFRFPFDNSKVIFAESG